MCPDTPSLLDNLSLIHWYKYLLYLAGVLLVLAVVFGSKIAVADVISFSLWTIFLCTILWIIDGVIRAVDINDRDYNSLVAGRTFVHLFVFIIWTIMAFATLL
jgi:hypothetical protein